MRILNSGRYTLCTIVYGGEEVQLLDYEYSNRGYDIIEKTL